MRDAGLVLRSTSGNPAAKHNNRKRMNETELLAEMQRLVPGLWSIGPVPYNTQSCDIQATHETGLRVVYHADYRIADSVRYAAYPSAEIEAPGHGPTPGAALAAMHRTVSRIAGYLPSLNAMGVNDAQ